MSGLELGWRDMFEFAVKPSLVEPVDVLGDGDLHVVDRLPGTATRVADQSGRFRGRQRNPSDTQGYLGAMLETCG